MSLFDSLKKAASDAVKDAVKTTQSNANTAVNRAIRGAAQNLTDNISKKLENAANKKETFAFESLPKTVEEMKALPEATLVSPFATAALTVCALCVYAEDRENGKEMLNFLKGPQPLTPAECQFIQNRFMDGKKYIPYSYFDGAVADNDYTPLTPYTITVWDNPYSYNDDGYAVLHIKSGGADSMRQVKLRRKGDQWFLWEQFLLPDVRMPKSMNPWA